MKLTTQLCHRDPSFIKWGALPSPPPPIYQNKILEGNQRFNFCIIPWCSNIGFLMCDVLTGKEVEEEA